MQLLAEFRKRLAQKIKDDAASEAIRQDENIRNYQSKLRERWRWLEEQKVVSESAEDAD